jgi:hypothetical protein
MAKEPESQRVYRVFVSSTYLDNAARRKRVREAIERAGMLPIPMERFTADEQPPVEVCLAKVREADVFVGIIAWRYGWIPPGREKSITQLEHEDATAAKLPRLLFVIDSMLPLLPEEAFDPGPERWMKQEKLAAFKAAIASGGSTPVPFTDEDIGSRSRTSTSRSAPSSTSVPSPRAPTGTPRRPRSTTACARPRRTSRSPMPSAAPKATAVAGASSSSAIRAPERPRT